MSNLIGSKPDQVPTNNMLGQLAFLDVPPAKATITVASFTTNTSTYINVDLYDIISITGQSSNLLFNNPIGNPKNGQSLIIAIKDNGTTRALTYDTKYRSIGTAFTSSTTASKLLYMFYMYNLSSDTWDLIYKAQQA